MLLSIVSGLSQAEASVESCLSSEDVKIVGRSISTKFLEPSSLNLCDSQSKEFKLHKILNTLKNLKISKAPLVNRYNQNIVGHDFWAYFTKRVSIIQEADLTAQSCASGALAYVSQVESPNVVFLCPVFFEDGPYTVYEKISILLHEARHVEGFAHSMCLVGSKVSAMGGCDELIEEQGAYAVSTESLAKMFFRGINIPDDERAKLKLALLESLESFNEQVQGLGNTAIYLEGVDGKSAYYFDGVSLHRASYFQRSHVVSRLLNLQIFPLNGAEAYGVDVLKYNPTRLEAEGICSKSYNQSPKHQRELLVDVIQDSIFSACVYENSLFGRIGFEEGEDVHINFPFKVSSVFTSDEVRNYERDSFYVRSSGGEFYRVRFTEGSRFVTTKVSDSVKEFSKIFFFNSDLTALTKNGKLLRLDSDSNEWVPFLGLEERRFKSSTRPVIWSKDLLD